ncbi:uncharacterized protein Z520_11984 [Fonsecaea multimorphosa CBS 102226]|uniref:Uncharacterized protein n=1 Tax=Fonsecaea multimorphosa CBS 102226 TaxID=1442371 RepID=A0A0D2K7B7_9EURO|nr:uncharacterized protein Z520_11984 [Fonsecaea multimorphosa CBS 102226]KIX92238.1 hypothetical protein Z520_11984 [Fonsecaea multimorphosa CBS 102226]OAL17614.1 hypothetical protein AYO22_11404 [Fonsecaea multimorphosa]
MTASWNEVNSKWVVKLRRLYTPERPTDPQEWEEDCGLLLNGCGFLNAWKWPDIPRLHSFKGDLFHTATYNEGFDLRGKFVAVIGNGSSGVQAVAEVYKHASKLVTWVRSPTWIIAAIGQAKGKRSSETAESDENAFAYSEMKEKLRHRPDIFEALLPRNFSVNCRRPTPGNGYLEALAGEKTTVLPGSIQSVTSSGVVDTAGVEHKVDVILCATGFDTSFRPRIPIIGLDPKTTLAEKWAEFPASYLGASADGFPNYFTYGGPFTAVAIFAASLREPQRCTTSFGTWYKMGTKDLRKLVMWPGSQLSYFEMIQQPFLQDYEIEYLSGNRFGFMGNGFCGFEFTGTKDMTWNLDRFSGRDDLRAGVPRKDPHEFKDLADGRVP